MNSCSSVPSAGKVLLSGDNKIKALWPTFVNLEQLFVDTSEAGADLQL